MKTSRLPYPIYFWQVASYSLLGLSTSVYLAYIHYQNYTDLTFSSFCAITQAVNCDTVAQSPLSIFLGLPVALWGGFAYLLFLILLAPLRKFKDKNFPAWSLITVLAVLASCVSVYLAILSAIRIHSWCVLCLVTYAANFLVAFTSWITFRRFSETAFITSIVFAFKLLFATTPVKLGVPLLIASVLATRLLLPTYWVQNLDITDNNVATGVTDEGHPWIGAEVPLLTIEEFTDYQCFQCSKVHFFLRQLINQHPDHIRLVHHHYPLDHEFNRIIAPTPFHVGSGRLALIAIVAAEHGTFWPVHDALYQATHSQKNSIDIKPLATLIGIKKEELTVEMFAAQTQNRLQQDISKGLHHKITGTPSFLINGKVYEKTIPSDLLRDTLK